MILISLLDVSTVKPTVEIADIFRLHFDDYLQQYHCTAEEFAAVNAIIKCRTAAMGGHIRCCDSCGGIQIAYNSCNNRHCPKCGAFEKAQWLAKQAARLIPVPHFQVVFTVDHLVNDLAYVNPQPIYDLLFASGVTHLGSDDAASHPSALYGDRWGIGQHRGWLQLAECGARLSLSGGGIVGGLSRCILQRADAIGEAG